MHFFKKKQEDPNPQLTQIELIDGMIHAEHTMLDKYSGLKVGKTVHIINVPIILNGKEEYIHTVRCGDDQKEDLVLLHGYLVGMVSFFGMLKDLSQHYRVWCFDLIGMGLSSRPEFTCQSTEETVDYFVDSIEQWRQKVGIERFHMVGQSFGGYMSGMYALRYPERVKKLILMSPAGVTRPGNPEEVAEGLKKFSFLKRQAIKLASSIWAKKYTPHVVVGKLGPLKNLFLKGYVKRTNLKGEEFELGCRYISSIFKLPESTLKALHYILTVPRAAGCLPLEDKMPLLKMPIEIYYGDRDWMSSEGAYRVAASGQAKVRIHIIPNAGHIMNFENPEHIIKLMAEHKLKEDEEIEVNYSHSLKENVVDLETEKELHLISEENIISTKAAPVS